MNFFGYDDFDDNRSHDYTDNALICKNGHVVNDSMKTNPKYNSKYCENCGAETISACTNCNTPITGKEYIENYIDCSEMSAPKYCKHCGNPYPWTEAKILAVNELVDLMDELNDKEKQDLKETTEIISTDNPRTQVGVLKIKKYLAKAGSTFGSAVQKILVDVASETAIKMMKEQGMI